ncbi:MAG: hypothetical protein ACU843_07495 [Gammaproteobacteria bacterium]
MRTNRPVSGVQVLSGVAGGDFGSADLPSPIVTDPNDPYNTGHTERDIYAVVGYIGDAVIVLGFMFPQVAECLFADKNRKIYRHASDVYFTVDSAGNTELAHPSGTYLRIAEAPAHEDLTGLDYDEKWKIDNNTDKLVHVHLDVQNGGESKALISIDPDGNVTVTSNNGDISVEATAGNVSLDAGADISITAGGNFSVQASRIDLN